MTQIKLSCGFEAEIDEAAVNDMEFLDALTQMQEGDPTGLSVICDMLLNKKDKKRLYDAVRDENGRATVEAVSAKIKEIFDQLGSKKK